MKEWLARSKFLPPRSANARRLAAILVAALSVALGLEASPHLGPAGAYGPLLAAAIVNTFIGGLWPSILTQLAGGTLLFVALSRPWSEAISPLQIGWLVTFFVVAKLSMFLVLTARHSRALLRTSEQMEMIAQATHDCIWDWNLQTGYVWRAGKVSEIFGCSPSEVIPDVDWWRLRVDPEQRSAVWASLQTAIGSTSDRWDCEYRLRNDGVTQTYISDRARIVRNGKGVAIRVLGGMADISAERRAEERLLYHASHDPLTGLPNRGSFLRRIESGESRSAYRAVLFVDLDQFKGVNVSFGHQVGDELLTQVAQRLKQHLRAGDVASRVGGDEFTILLERVAESSEALKIAQDILQSFNVPFQVSGRTLSITASIGVAVSPHIPLLELLQRADSAMYQAKRQGRARCQVFDANLESRARAHRKLEAEFTHSFQDGTLRLHYQPIVSLSTGSLTSFEALLRWQHPRNGMIYPSEVLPIAENAGLSINLSQWVLRDGCSQLRAWRDQQGFRSLDLNLNLSGTEFSRPALVDEVRALLNETGIPGESLIIELTETTIMESNVDAARRLSLLRDMGIRLALDDFGKGHSSLGRLQDFPISMLKIDSSFVQQIRFGRRQILDAIIALGHELKLEITAEGVETSQQLIYLREKGAAKVQGLLFAPALPADAATELLLRQSWNLEEFLGSTEPERSSGSAAG